MPNVEKVWVRVCALNDIPAGKATNIFVNGQRFVIMRTKDAAYITQGYCTHMLYPLKDAVVGDDCILTCNLHGSKFDVRDGSIKYWPMPAADDILKRKALQIFPTRVEEGVVYVEWPGTDASKIRIKL